MLTFFARSHMWTSIPMHGHSSSSAVNMASSLSVQKRSAGTGLSLEDFHSSGSLSEYSILHFTQVHSVTKSTQEQRNLLVEGIHHHSQDRCWSLVRHRAIRPTSYIPPVAHRKSSQQDLQETCGCNRMDPVDESSWSVRRVSRSVHSLLRLIMSDISGGGSVFSLCAHGGAPTPGRSDLIMPLYRRWNLRRSR